MKHVTRMLALCALASSPVWAASLTTTGPAQPLPEIAVNSVALPVAENLTAGSAALVPLVAADIPAERISTIDAGAVTAGGDIGKPIDDISFLARAVETSRKESGAAREALPRLQDLELKRLAEELIRAHGDASARMEKIAADKRWPLPAAQRDAPPAGTASADFDATWTEDMIFAHERSLALYAAQAQGGEDPELRRYARETLPTIQHHLAELRRLQK